jgi:tetratricopeptide (TPR) repeat protein
MLETIREYATERLAAAGETEELRRRHLDHYATVAADCYDETFGGQDDLERLASERDNLRVALDVALETDPELALDLATHLTQEWDARGEFREGSKRIAAAMAGASGSDPRRRASGLLSLGKLAMHHRGAASSQAVFLEALAIARTLGDRILEGRALRFLGYCAYDQGDRDGALRLFNEAVDALDIPGAEGSRQWALAGMITVISDLGNHTEALARQRELVASARTRSDYNLATQLNNLGVIERTAGETEHARRSIEESITLSRLAGRTSVLSVSLISLGFTLHDSAPKDALAAFSEGIQLAREMDAPDLVAYSLEGAAAIFAGWGDPAHAASLLGAVASIRAGIGDTRNSFEKAEADATEGQCREALTPDEFTAAWNHGAALDANAAADWALQIWAQPRA